MRCMGGTLALTLCVCLIAGCSDRRVRARIDESGPPVRGGTLELVGSSDVDHLATTSAYVISVDLAHRDIRPSAAGLSPRGMTMPSRRGPRPTWRSRCQRCENGGISADGLSYTFPPAARRAVGQPPGTRGHGARRRARLQAVLQPGQPGRRAAVLHEHHRRDGRLLRTVRARARHGDRHPRLRDHAGSRGGQCHPTTSPSSFGFAPARLTF